MKSKLVVFGLLFVFSFSAVGQDFESFCKWKKRFSKKVKKGFHMDIEKEKQRVKSLEVLHRILSAQKPY